MKIALFDGLGELPLFNADLEADLPPHVVALRSAVSSADALLVASPEYAHGVSGVMKNALDWLVGADDFAGKPVALVNSAPRAHHAHESLREILRTMSASLVAEACLTVPLLGACGTECGMLASPELAAEIRRALAALTRS
jgi:NAD(P)H-dependent FMN reductase